MKPSQRLVAISPKVYRTFHSAAILLSGELGVQAPSPAALIERELANRKPGLIAEEYIEEMRRVKAKRRAARLKPVRPRSRFSAEESVAQFDPSNN